MGVRKQEIQQEKLLRSALLGGPTGGEFIVGGFPAWTRKQQILDWGETHFKKALAEETRANIQELGAPGKRGSILVVKLRPAETPFETRKMMFAAVKELSQAKVKLIVGLEKYALWSGPSKPACIRQQDVLVTDALNNARKLFEEPRVDFDNPKQRIFCDDRLIAFRPQDSERL